MGPLLTDWQNHVITAELERAYIDDWMTETVIDTDGC